MSDIRYSVLDFFSATLVAIHFTPASESVGNSFGLASLGACELVKILIGTDIGVFG